MDQPPETRQCKRCGREMPWTREYFAWRPSSGVRQPCKECAKEYMRQWRKNNTEALSDYMVQWRKDNAEHVSQYDRAYKETHTDAIRKRRKRYYAEHFKEEIESQRKYYELHADIVHERRRRRYQLKREYYQAHNRQWYETHRVEKREYDRKRRAENPKYFKIKAHRRYSRKRNLPITLMLQDWEHCLAYWNNQCAYCGNTRYQSSGGFLCVEHFIPLAHLDCPGTIPDNILPACISCNASKQHKDALSWMIEKFGEDYAREKLLQIHTYFEHIGQKNLND